MGFLISTYFGHSSVREARLEPTLLEVLTGFSLGCDKLSLVASAGSGPAHAPQFPPLPTGALPSGSWCSQILPPQPPLFLTARLPFPFCSSRHISLLCAEVSLGMYLQAGLLPGLPMGSVLLWVPAGIRGGQLVPNCGNTLAGEGLQCWHHFMGSHLRCKPLGE